MLQEFQRWTLHELVMALMVTSILFVIVFSVMDNRRRFENMTDQIQAMDEKQEMRSSCL